MYVLVFIIEPWMSVSVSISIFLAVFGFLRWNYGPEFVRQAEWKEEGFSSIVEWWKKSQSFNANLFRVLCKYLIPIFIIFTIIIALIVAFIKYIIKI